MHNGKSNPLVAFWSFLDKVTTLFWISETLEEFGHFTQLFVNLVQYFCIPFHNPMYGLMYKEDSVQLVVTFLGTFDGLLH